MKALYGCLMRFFLLLAAYRWQIVVGRPGQQSRYVVRELQTEENMDIYDLIRKYQQSQSQKQQQSAVLPVESLFFGKGKRKGHKRAEQHSGKGKKSAKDGKGKSGKKRDGKDHKKKKKHGKKEHHYKYHTVAPVVIHQPIASSPVFAPAPTIPTQPVLAPVVAKAPSGPVFPTRPVFPSVTSPVYVRPRPVPPTIGKPVGVPPPVAEPSASTTMEPTNSDSGPILTGMTFELFYHINQRRRSNILILLLSGSINSSSS